MQKREQISLGFLFDDKSFDETFNFLTFKELTMSLSAKLLCSVTKKTIAPKKMIKSKPALLSQWTCAYPNSKVRVSKLVKYN